MLRAHAELGLSGQYVFPCVLYLSSFHFRPSRKGFSLRSAKVQLPARSSDGVGSPSLIRSRTTTGVTSAGQLYRVLSCLSSCLNLLWLSPQREAAELLSTISVCAKDGALNDYRRIKRAPPTTIEVFVGRIPTRASRISTPRPAGWWTMHHRCAGVAPSIAQIPEHRKLERRSPKWSLPSKQTPHQMTAD